MTACLQRGRDLRTSRYCSTRHAKSSRHCARGARDQRARRAGSVRCSTREHGG